MKWAEIKFSLLARGAKITSTADTMMHDVKRPVRTRSGVSGGLDIRLPCGIDVNVPVREAFALESDLYLDHLDGAYVLRKGETLLSNFDPLPTPAYYRQLISSTGEPMHRIAQMCSADRFCYGMTGPTCFFWKRTHRCQYCVIGKTYSEDAARKQAEHFMEVLEVAVEDPYSPARHVLLGGGTPTGEDMGAVLAARLCRSVKERFPNLSVYVMIAAPLKDRYIHELRDAGADEVGFNLEFWSDEAWNEFIPGKHREIGKARYLEALETAVELFGPINTRSILIAGLEPLSRTLEAAQFLAQMGVMPIVSPFRPIDGAVLAERRGPSPADYVSLWSAIDASLKPLNMPLGPTCVACQNNTLALPTDSRYRKY